jgi:hypothetical protein
MHVTLGNGNIEMGAVRLANGNWAVLLQKHDATHAIGENANNVGEQYVPNERDVVIELGSIASARVLQDAVNHALLFATGLIPPIDARDTQG